MRAAHVIGNDIDPSTPPPPPFLSTLWVREVKKASDGNLEYNPHKHTLTSWKSSHGKELMCTTSTWPQGGAEASTLIMSLFNMREEEASVEPLHRKAPVCEMSIDIDVLHRETQFRLLK